MMSPSRKPSRQVPDWLRLVPAAASILYGSGLCGLGISKFPAFSVLSVIFLLLGLVCIGSGVALARSLLAGGFAAAAATMLGGLAIGYGFIATGEPLLGFFLIAAFVTLCALIGGIFASLLSLEQGESSAHAHASSSGSMPEVPGRDAGHDPGSHG